MEQQDRRAKAAFEDAAEAFAREDYADVRRLCDSVLDLEVPAYQHSYARLRIAQSHTAERNLQAAQAEYRTIVSDPRTPALYRDEATTLLARTMGTESTDASTRTQIPAVHPAVEYFVSPDGDDTGTGMPEQPFATLERAREAVRETKRSGLPAGGIAVTLKPGEYGRATLFSLSPDDSGEEGSPVVYRAEVPGTAVLYGGARLAGFTRVQDEATLRRLPEQARGQVYQCDLRGQGITHYGRLAVRGCGQPASPPTIELYFDGEPMTPARWPNEGFVSIEELLEPGQKGKTPSVFRYGSPRHERWVDAEDPWLFGYFRWLWADGTLPVGSIDPESKTLTTAEAYDYHGGMDTTQGIIYYAFNLLEEIDSPGEWYLNRDTGILYFWPPSDPSQATVEIGMLPTRMISLSHTSHVRIEGITLDLGLSLIHI